MCLEHRCSTIMTAEHWCQAGNNGCGAQVLRNNGYGALVLGNHYSRARVNPTPLFYHKIICIITYITLDVKYMIGNKLSVFLGIGNIG